MKDLKLHLACGTVYLKDYINIDAVGYYKQVRPDLLEENMTTFDNYYKDIVTPKDFMSYKFKRREVVVDLIGDITDLGNIFMGSDFGIAKNSVSEIVAIQVLEHFTFSEASKVLENWRKYMKLGASIRIHVTDLS